jgi:large subunit ribosomal protein L17
VPERRLRRTTGQQKALFRAQVTSLLRHESMITTHARAKEVSAIAEELITLAKEPTLAHRRQAARFLLDEEVLRKLFRDIAPRYRERPGGYTRVLKLGPRRGDAAPMVKLELV